MEEFWNLSDEYGFSEHLISANLDHNLDEGFEGVPLQHDSPNFSFGFAVPDHGIGNTSPSVKVEAGFIEEAYLHNPVLKYINQVLMEEDAEDEGYFIEDSTLHAAEKALYDILNDVHCPSSSEPIHHQDSISLDATSSNSPGCCFKGHVNASNFPQTGFIKDFCNSSHGLNPPVHKTFMSKPVLGYTPSSSYVTGDGPMLMQSPINVHEHSQFSLQFKWGIRESRMISRGKAKAEKDEDELTTRLQCGKSLLGENNLKEGRGSNQLGISTEDLLSEILDRMLHFNCDKEEATSNSNDGILPKNGGAKGLGQRVKCLMKQINKKDHFDMKNLLILCMESVANDDHNIAYKLLKQIKQLSSPSGNASQRLAHCFAKGLEGRLAGTGNLIYRSLAAKVWSPSKGLVERLAGTGNLIYRSFAHKVSSTSDALEVYNLYISTFPFLNASRYYEMQTILEFAKKATSLHIIQFGTGEATQFMPLIQQLSNRPFGPPKLRITLIDFPEPSFEPVAMVEETVRHLVNYCKKFNISFEFHCMPQKWETIDVEDLKIQKDEVLIVVCSYLFHHLMDDSFLENSPRDAVLKLIKRINPDVFIHGILNGSHNSLFFVSRFRKALFHFSVIFDMFEATMPKENPWRMIWETEIVGKEIFNIIACEGLERIERPETYKSWQARTLRAGFRQLPLNKEIIKKLKVKVKDNHHKDFFLEEVDQWMVQGWKGRVFFALSCWKPN